MLVLTRRVGEEIVIGGNIRVTVVMVNRQRVRLGITAPPSVPIARLELLGDSPRPHGRQRPADAPISQGDGAHGPNQRHEA